jgi:hypothetical protein
MTLNLVRALTGSISCLILQGFVGRPSLNQRPSTGKEVIDDPPISLQRVLLIHPTINPKRKPQEVLQLLLSIQAYILHPKLMLHSLTNQSLSQLLHLLFDALDRFLVKSRHPL